MATYRLIRKLATGGMAEVFLAKGVGAEGFEKPVAVKRILPALAEDRGFVELFLREAKLTVALQHANVVQVFDLGARGGHYYMVLEFVDGENLRELQTEAGARGVALGLREVCFIVQQVAEGLAYAHGRADAAGQPLHVIHRDVNPSNVMVSAAGEVKLADFGIAKAANAQGTTQVGRVKGKSGYVSPEQILRGEADQRSDLFLIGLLLYELLAGRQLFGDPDYFQSLRAIARFDVGTLPALPGVPPALWRIVTRALAQDPAARFQRARELSDALRDFLFDHRLRVGPREMAELFARVFPSRRSPLELAAGEEGEEIRLEASTPPRAATRPPAAAPPPLPSPDRHTGTRERLLAVAALEPAAPAPALVPGDLLARTILVVADDAEQRDAAVRLLARQGVAAAASSGADAVQAAALGGFELALLAANTLPDARALGESLGASAAGLNVRVLSSLGEALGGETGPLERSTQLQARVLDAALGMLGGAAEQGPALARLARGIARRLGAGQVEADRAAAAAYAVAFAARMEGSGRFARPAPETVRALLGADAAELAPLLAVCAPGAGPAAAEAGRAEQALSAALLLMEAAGGARPAPAPATQALAALRSAGQLGAAAMEALAAEVLEVVVRDRPAP